MTRLLVNWARLFGGLLSADFLFDTKVSCLQSNRLLAPSPKMGISLTRGRGFTCAAREHECVCDRTSPVWSLAWV